jgi:hypothetical protein
MIATILKSSSTFSAVDYNERKVSKGTAELLEIKNFDLLEKTGNITPTTLRDYLVRYSSQNENIKNTQFHLAISCKKDEYSYDELIKIAHQYLSEMGYGDPRQPLLIYGHHDTANNHIHIVTSRVNPQGRKIEHDNERRRSQAVINKIMGVKPKQEAKSIIQQSLAYSFETLGQYQAILESSGYESYIENDKVNVKKGGIVLDRIPVKEVERNLRKKTKEETDKRRKQLKAILLKYRQLAYNKEVLASALKKTFGVSLIFVGKKDHPYGYMVVDHKEKAVYKGSDILQIIELLNSQRKQRTSKEGQKEAISALIQHLLKEGGKQTIGDINQVLWRKFGVNIYQDGFVRDKHHKPIIQVDPQAFEVLRGNFKIQWLQKFNPSTEEERAILCRFGRIENVDDIQIEPVKNTEKLDATVNHIKDILNTAEKGHVYEELGKAKIIVIRKEEALYAIDMGSSTIVNLRETDIDISMLVRQNRLTTGRQLNVDKNSETNSEKTKHSQHNNAGNVLRPTGSGHHTNREWEVGTFDNWDDIDDERRLRR